MVVYKMYKSFTNELSYLSNMYLVSVNYEGVWYRSVENAYQAAKTNDLTEREIFTKVNPYEAKKLGKSVTIRDDWDSVKDGILEILIREKFKEGSDLALKLMIENPNKLIELNSWHDNHFGNCVCAKCKRIPGKNVLGKLLAKRRYELLGNN